MDRTRGISALDAIQRPKLAPLPPDIESAELLTPVEVESVAPAVAAAPTAPSAAELVPPSIPPEPPVAVAPEPELAVPHTPMHGHSPASFEQPAPTPWAEVAATTPPTDNATPSEFEGMFPPTGAEVAAQLQAEQDREEAKAAAAKANAEVQSSRFRKRKTPAIVKKPQTGDLRPPGMSPIVMQILNGVAILALIVVAYFGYLLYQRVQSATLVTQLESGQCVTDFFSEAEGEFRNVFLVNTGDCAELHAYEVFSTSSTVFDDIGTSDYLGVERTFAMGQEYCQAQYDEFVGGNFLTSPWQVWTFVPTEPRWDRGERKVQCLVGDASEQVLIEGSLKDTGK